MWDSSGRDREWTWQVCCGCNVAMGSSTVPGSVQSRDLGLKDGHSMDLASFQIPHDPAPMPHPRASFDLSKGFPDRLHPSQGRVLAEEPQGGGSGAVPQPYPSLLLWTPVPPRWGHQAPQSHVRVFLAEWVFLKSHMGRNSAHVCTRTRTAQVPDLTAPRLSGSPRPHQLQPLCPAQGSQAGPRLRPSASPSCWSPGGARPPNPRPLAQDPFPEHLLLPCPPTPGNTERGSQKLRAHASEVASAPPAWGQQVDRRGQRPVLSPALWAQMFWDIPSMECDVTGSNSRI